MARRQFLSVVLFALIASVPAVLLAAEAAPEPAPPTASAPPAAECAAAVGDLPLFQPAPIAMTCTAEYNCVHGTIVSCTGPVNGTCQSSGQGCGRVTCNGQTTRCPGTCVGDHHCATFCGFSPTASCDEFGCCVC